MTDVQGRLPLGDVPPRPSSAHRCHRPGCNKVVPPRLLACAPDWKMLPRVLQDAVWATYVPGQERRKDPTDKYIEAAQACVAWWRENA